MEAIHFAYWMQGALELGQCKELNEAQVKIVQDHLNLVLKKVTPQYNLPQMPGIGIGTPRPSIGDQLFRNTPSIHDAVC
jgi:hypothetical protein